MINDIDTHMLEFFERVNKEANLSKFMTTKKQDGSPVTELDMFIHHLFFDFCEGKALQILAWNA